MRRYLARLLRSWATMLYPRDESVPCSVPMTLAELQDMIRAEQRARGVRPTRFGPRLKAIK